MNFRNPFAILIPVILAKSDFKSTLCLLVFSIVSIVLAYLTNPSENSFRLYLTEQSFRHHLSRLDDNADDLTKRQSALADNPSPFHFANRASVSLRTPKHVFHSFGIFTIAAMMPLPTSGRAQHRDELMISDSWYIGAFGKWWRGGIIEAWYQDVVVRSKDEESWSSGILGMKSLDNTSEYEGLPFSTKNLPAHLFARGSPPKLRNRDKSSSNSALPSKRSSTPPPLPKSASLPLHTSRSSSKDVLNSQTVSVTHTFTPPVPDPSCFGLQSRSPSSLFDHSPLIAEVLRQITQSKTLVLDLRTQLADCQSSATQSHSVLQTEVDAFRDKKRQEDVVKLDLKTQTKILDESKRVAEGLKREAEKKLKSTHLAREKSSHRIGDLDAELTTIKRCILADEAFLIGAESGVPTEEQQLEVKLETKRQEIKAAEHVVATLSSRARELEDKLASQQEKLRRIAERAQSRKRDQELLAQQLMNSSSHNSSATWSPIRYEDTTLDPNFTRGPLRQVEATVVAEDLSQHHGSGAFTALANICISPQGYNLPNDSATPGPGFISHPNDADHVQQFTSLHSSPIPSGMHPLDIRDFRYHRYPEQDWRTVGFIPQDGFSHPSPTENQSSKTLLASSLTTSNAYPADDHHQDEHDYGFLLRSEGSPDRTTDRHHHVSWPHHPQPELKANAHEEAVPVSPELAEHLSKVGPRRWFSGAASSVKERAKKGLNPDAKVFSLSRVPGPTPSSYDALNPNGLGSKLVSSTSLATNSSSLFLRAFAPSPEEREALQRALGGSTNTSYERLPSLSGVESSMPPSPVHGQAQPLHHPLSALASRQPPQHGLGKVLPHWMQGLPDVPQVKFSPWGDEDSAGETFKNEDVGMSSVIGIRRRG